MMPWWRSSGLANGELPLWSSFAPYLLNPLDISNENDVKIAAARYKMEAVGGCALDGAGKCDFDGNTGTGLEAKSSEVAHSPSAAGWTAQAYFRLTDTPAASYAILSRYRIDNDARCWLIKKDSNNKLDMYMTSDGIGGGGNELQMTGTTTLVAATDYHVAFVQSGNDFFLFLNGQIEATTTQAFAVKNTGTAIRVGSIFNNNFVIPIKGKVWRTEVRREALWTEAFTPPTGILVPDKNAVFSLNYVGDALSKRVIDSARPSYDNGSGVETDPGAIPGLIYDTSGNEYDSDVFGNPVYTGVDDKLSFDGNDYLSAPAVSLSGLRTYYWKAINTKPIATNDSLWGDSNCLCQMNTSGHIVVNAGTGATMVATDYSGVEHVFALEISAGGVAKLYIDGNLVGTQTVGTGANAALGMFARNDGDSPVVASSKVPVIVHPSGYQSGLSALVAQL
jgi:hypothetical protein